MDWLEKMNNAMDYIEANIANEISYDKAAHIACCSTYHFQRMFAFITNVPLSEYIRRRRLTMAAFDLQTSDIKVIDAAYKYKYESPEAFSRAFKILHGVTPISARDKGTPLKAYPKMTFSISIKGDTEMNYRIEQREAFEVFGVCGVISANMEQAFNDVPQFCKKCDEDGTVKRMNDLLGRFSDSYLHSALYDHSDDGFKYMICYHTPKNGAIPKDFTRLEVPEQTWAVFTEPNCEMQNLWRRIYSEWFPASGYDQAEGPTFEMYYGQARHQNGFGEIWIPVKKK